MTRRTRTQSGRAVRLTIGGNGQGRGPVKARKCRRRKAAANGDQTPPDAGASQAQPGTTPVRRTPAWLSREVRYWAGVLGLADWSLEVWVVTNPGRPNWQASAAPCCNLREATLRFRQDVSPTPGWRRVVCHEVLHVAHAFVDHLVELRLAGLVDEAARQLVVDLYTDVLETFVERCAYALQVTDAKGRGADVWNRNRNKNKRPGAPGGAP